MTDLLIIGGSDAGISAALRAQELDPKVNITVVLADRFPNYSICGLPFFLSGEVSDWRQLAHRTAAEITRGGIHLLVEHRAEAIDPTAKTVRVVDGAGQTCRLPYDRLVIGTGAVPSSPPIERLDLPGVFLLRSMADSLAVEEYLVRSQPRSALIIGGVQNRMNFGLLAAFGDAQNWLPWQSSNYSRLAGQNEPLLQQLQVGSPKHLPFQHFESIILPFNRSIANL